ncbi:serine hydrolase domain-containing protein [Rubrimonas cliftonensis]|uniref:Methyl acetate hydrolase n=1 Tax=Rubrimonas cliftonensis TaxID=89524 RepID=A0A1H3XS81_9RHOB|nr:serine hydrolase domain-containing protein [Rubrimonas cliftonensis]SEA01454.1 methyl acetate hydrolase [Rubrimonas cliftonensis]
MEALTSTLDALLDRVVAGPLRAPGVAALATDRNGVLYEGAAGLRRIDGDAPFTPDTVCAIYSTTKAVAATAALQLVEEGRLDLDAPAKRYLPEIGELQVLDGFDAAGAPRLRPPKRDVTTRMLLLHTSGFGYPTFNAAYLRLVREHGRPDVATATRAAFRLPLLFDPGEGWEYGVGLDWAGMVVEAIAGARLGAVLAERVFAPCGMTSTAFTPTSQMLTRRASLHQRRADGSLKPLDVAPLADPEVHMGGGGLYGTATDYIRFIRMWLNDGMGDAGRVLRPETVAMAARNGLGDRRIGALPAVIPALTREAEFFPGLPKSWGLSFMINDAPAPTGRPAGALAWAGLANLYYWIDRENGVGGFWATQILPFFDPTSLQGFLDFETAVYRAMAKPGAA